MGQALEIRRLGDDAEARAAAGIMAGMSPWTVYGRDREACCRQVTHPLAESYVALSGAEVVGVVVVAIEVPLIRGYVWALAVSGSWQERGVGAKLLAAAEERVFRDSPNVFICVTSFNEGAQRFYARQGYERVGVLRDYVLAGVDEWLLRKSRGAIRGYAGVGGGGGDGTGLPGVSG